MIGIYKITSPSGKVYIGQSWTIELRLSKYKQTKWDKQRKLYCSFKKYGLENHKFEVVHELPVDVEQEVLDRYEQLYMDLYRDCGIELLNLREGGSRGKLSEESKKLMSDSRKGTNLGHTFNNGRKHSYETKQKHSEISKIINSTIEYKENMRKSIINSEAHKKYRERLKEEGRLGIHKTYDRNGYTKPVLQFSKNGNFIKEWTSASEFQKHNNIIGKGNIGSCCKGKLKTAYGFTWKFKNN
jgi:hypothetical protein